MSCSWLSICTVRRGSAIRVVSVISSSRLRVGTSWRSNTERQLRMKLACLSCLSDRLMRDAARVGYMAAQRAEVHAHAFQHPFADGADQIVLFGDRDELRRRNIAMARQAPAQQRLGADHAAVAQVHLRLVAHHELVALDRAPQLALEHQRSTAAAFISGE